MSLKCRFGEAARCLMGRPVPWRPVAPFRSSVQVTAGAAPLPLPEVSESEKQKYSERRNHKSRAGPPRARARLGLRGPRVATVRCDPWVGRTPVTQRFSSACFLLYLGLTHTNGVTAISLPVCLKACVTDDRRMRRVAPHLSTSPRRPVPLRPVLSQGLAAKRVAFASAFVPFSEDLGNLSDGPVYTKVATGLLASPLHATPTHTHTRLFL